LSDTGAVEVWRGTVATWECDGMGHMNVRFHLLRAMQGLAGAAAALGMPHAFAAHAPATLIVREHHVRFLREAREGAIQHMTASVVDIGETEALIQLILFDSISEETCATFLTRVAHAAGRSARPFPWPARAYAAAEALKAPVAANAGPRSVPALSSGPTPSLAQAEAMGLTRGGLSVVMPEDCDVFGRLRIEMFMGRLSASIGHTINPFRRAAQAAQPGIRMGGAALEYRLVYFAQPHAGDRIDVRAGLVEVTPKLARIRHWLLDPVTGAPWAEAENIVVNFDLDSRRAVSLSTEAAAQLQSKVTGR
jgi:acyl-CoA thioester hydrolase